MKKLCYFVLILILNFNVTYAVSENDIQNFLNELKNYTNDNFSELGSENILNEIIDGGIIEKEKMISKVGNIFLKEIREAILLVTKILIVTIFCCFLKNIGPQTESSVKDIAFYICYLVIIRSNYKFIYKY